MLKEKTEKVEETSVKVAEVTTPNLVAYQHYFKGEEYFNKLHMLEAIKEYEKAIELDSTFALAYFKLAFAKTTCKDYYELKNDASFQKAVKQINNLPPKERYIAHALGGLFFKLDKQEEFSIKEALKILNEMEKKYPDDKEMLNWKGVMLWASDKENQSIK